MNPSVRIAHQFVEHVPAQLANNTVYVSIPYSTALHKCMCGCGAEVVTPIRPISWQLLFDGETISLYPSIGNWSLPCRSHYWIRRNFVIWAGDWSDEQVAAARVHEQFERDLFFGTPAGVEQSVAENKAKESVISSRLSRIANVLRRRFGR